MEKWFSFRERVLFQWPHSIRGKISCSNYRDRIFLRIGPSIERFGGSPVRAEVMMQAEDDNHQDNANDCVERQPVLIICSPIHRATHLHVLSDLSLANV